MYVFNIFLVSAPLRGFSGALKGCSESVPNNCYFSSLSNRYVLISCFEMLLFAAIWTRVVAGKLFHAIGPAAENPRFCMDVDWQRGTTRQNWSADRKFRRPTTVEAGTQSSCRYDYVCIQNAPNLSNLSTVSRLEPQTRLMNLQSSHEILHHHHHLNLIIIIIYLETSLFSPLS